LDEIAELDVEVEGARLPIAEELVLKGAPDGASGGVAVDHRLAEVGGDRAGDPGFDDAIHARPVWQLGRREIGKDVGLQRVLANDEEDLISPTGVVAGVQIEDDVDEAPNVLYADGLSVQVDDGGGFMSQDGVVKIGAGVDGVVVVVIVVGLLVAYDGTQRLSKVVIESMALWIWIYDIPLKMMTEGFARVLSVKIGSPTSGQCGAGL